jgi:hypothetical protein
MGGIIVGVAGRGEQCVDHRVDAGHRLTRRLGQLLGPIVLAGGAQRGVEALPRPTTTGCAWRAVWVKSAKHRYLSTTHRI